MDQIRPFVYAVCRSTKSGGMCATDINGTRVNVRVPSDLAPAIFDILIVAKVGSDWMAFGRVGSGGVGTVPTSDSTPLPTLPFGTLTVLPVETRSYRVGKGWRTDTLDVIQGKYGGQQHQGTVFFGTKPKSLEGATVTAATVSIRSRKVGKQPTIATTMRLVTEAKRPSGAPTLTSTTTGPNLKPGKTTTFALPTSWAQAFVDGTAGGIAFATSSALPTSYHVLAGRGVWSAAFTLIIKWKKN